MAAAATTTEPSGRSFFYKVKRKRKKKKRSGTIRTANPVSHQLSVLEVCEVNVMAGWWLLILRLPPCCRHDLRNDAPRERHPGLGWRRPFHRLFFFFSARSLRKFCILFASNGLRRTETNEAEQEANYRKKEGKTPPQIRSQFIGNTVSWKCCRPRQITCRVQSIQVLFFID